MLTKEQVILPEHNWIWSVLVRPLHESLSSPFLKGHNKAVSQCVSQSGRSPGLECFWTRTVSSGGCSIYDTGALTCRWSSGLWRYGNCERVAQMTLLSMLLSFKYVAPSQQASAWTSVRRGVCVEAGWGLLTPVSPRTRPPLWRGSLGWLSGQARDRYDRAADKGQAACWEQRCSPTQTRLLLSSLGLQRDPQLAAETPQSLWAAGFSTKLITVALMGLQNTNTENQKHI